MCIRDSIYTAGAAGSKVVVRDLSIVTLGEGGDTTTAPVEPTTTASETETTASETNPTDTTITDTTTEMCIRDRGYIEKKVPTGRDCPPHRLKAELDDFLSGLPFVPDGVGMAIPGLVEGDHTVQISNVVPPVSYTHLETVKAK